MTLFFNDKQKNLSFFYQFSYSAVYVWLSGVKILTNLHQTNRFWKIVPSNLGFLYLWFNKWKVLKENYRRGISGSTAMN